MGRAAVRAAVQQTVQNANVSYIGTVYPARPTILQEEDYIQTLQGQAIQESDNGSACVVVVNILRDKRTRSAESGFGAVFDFAIHDVALELWFACTSGDAVAAQDDYDAVVDGLTVAIRGNPTMGNPSAVWQAGTDKFGVEHTQFMPESPDDGLTVLITGTLSFQAWEQDAGTAGQV